MVAVRCQELLSVISFGAFSIPPLQRIRPCLPKDLGKARARSFCVTFVSRGRQAILPSTFGFKTPARIASSLFRAGTLVARSTGLRQTSSTVMLPQVAGLSVHASRCIQRCPVQATPVVITLALTTADVVSDSVMDSRVVWQLIYVWFEQRPFERCETAVEWSLVRNLSPGHSMATSNITSSLVQSPTRPFWRALVVQLE